MFKFLKAIKDNSDRIIKLQEKISEITKSLEDSDTYTAIGMPLTQNYNKRIRLLMEARSRGYFDERNYFVPVTRWSDTAYFKHKYTRIASNYRYFDNSESLCIPAIGVKGNFSSCVVCIYENGVWAKIMSDE